MKLTWRGRGLAATIVLVTASGLLFGARGLNAIVIPGVVVLLDSAYQIYRVEKPGIERDLPERGHRGETVRVEVRLAADASLPGRAWDDISEGLEATENDQDITLDRETVDYDLTLRRRGERSVGPFRITVRDVFGLVSQTFVYESDDVVFGSDGMHGPGRHSILVWPRIYPLTGAARTAITGLYGTMGDERNEFDYLRNYRRGDPLRDIHWKSSAKHPEEDYVVKEFTADENTDTVVLGAEAGAATIDATADATASIAVDLLDAEVDLVLLTPVARIEPDDERHHRDAILDHLARVGPGSLDTGAREAADVVVRGTENDVRIELDGRRHQFRDFVGTDAAPPDPGEGSQRPIESAEP